MNLGAADQTTNNEFLCIAVWSSVNTCHHRTAMAKSKTFHEMDVSEMTESTSAVVHCALVGPVSPVKCSHSSNVEFFEARASDGKKTARLISFEPKLRDKLEKAQESKQEVAITNCSVQRNKRSGSKELEIVLGSRTSVIPSPKKFEVFNPPPLILVY